MRKAVFLFVAFVLTATLALAGGLVTGEAKRPFKPGDKVLVRDDFKKCPVGEIPGGVDKVTGAGECVKYENTIWFAPISRNAGLIKKVFLGNDEFSIEFDLMATLKNCLIFP